MRIHLFPYRTQKLSSFVPTILGGRLPGKIGNARIKLNLRVEHIVGVDCNEVPPVPIPNTEVKLIYANNTWWVTAWEDR